MSKNAGRVIDLFREWDSDGDGTVTRAEFRKAIAILGLEGSKSDIGIPALAPPRVVCFCIIIPEL